MKSTFELDSAINLEVDAMHELNGKIGSLPAMREHWVRLGDLLGDIEMAAKKERRFLIVPSGA